jgi:hypothetical protein
MDSVPISRSRGAVCGLLLVLLGAWGGVAPFAGPAIRFGFTPDRAWEYTQGRLYLSAVPGAAVLLTGLIVMLTRSRWLGGFCAVIAALGGAWFVAGAALIRLFPASLGVGSVSPGTPLGVTTALRATATDMAFFVGLGAAVLFVAALAIGRFSVVGYKDYVRAEELVQAPGGGQGNGGLARIGLIPGSPQPSTYGTDPASTATYAPGQANYLGGQSQYPPQYPPDPGGSSTDPYPSANPFQQ